MVGARSVSPGMSLEPNVINADVDVWYKTTKDCSSAVTGSSVFAFNGDGKAGRL